eukprot:3312072-Rhodomonas_salina.3
MHVWMRRHSKARETLKGGQTVQARHCKLNSLASLSCRTALTRKVSEQSMATSRRQLHGTDAHRPMTPLRHLWY